MLISNFDYFLRKIIYIICFFFFNCCMSFEIRFIPYVSFNIQHILSTQHLCVKCLESDFGINFNRNFFIEFKAVGGVYFTNIFSFKLFKQNLIFFYINKGFSNLIDGFFFFTLSPVKFFSNFFLYKNKFNNLYKVSLSKSLFTNFHVGFGFSYIISKDFDVRISYMLKTERIFSLVTIQNGNNVNHVFLVSVIYFF